MSRTQRRNPVGHDPLDGLIPFTPTARSAPATTGDEPQPSSLTIATGFEAPAEAASHGAAAFDSRPAPGSQTTAEPTPPLAPAPTAAGGKRKERATFHVPVDLLNELRDAVVHLSGPPLRLNLAQVVEAALRREVDRLRLDHNGGQPFPRRDGELRGGRAIT